MSHTIHPDSHVAGLADGCPRCAEHAKDPLVTLDALNVRELVTRAANDSPARSQTEGTALANVEAALMHAGKIASAAPEILETYLLTRWHLPALIAGGSYDMTHEQRRKDENDAN